MKAMFIKIVTFFAILGLANTQVVDVVVAFSEWSYLTGRLSDGSTCRGNGITDFTQCRIVLAWTADDGGSSRRNFQYTVGPFTCSLCSFERISYHDRYRLSDNEDFSVTAYSSRTRDAYIDRWPHFGPFYAGQILGGNLLSGELGNALLSYYFVIKCFNLYGPSCRQRCFVDFSNSFCDPRTGNRVCLNGKLGTNCELDTHPCFSNVCQNGEVCIPNGIQFTCICPVNDSGSLCAASACTLENCVRGMCTDGACFCSDGFTGPECERQVCQPQTCDNGGTCMSVRDSLECTCPNTIAGGLSCQNRCPMPCVNGGLCLVRENTGYCDCPDGFTGVDCRIQIMAPNPCDNSPCINGGSCTPNPDSGYTCRCPTQWTGTNCQFDSCNADNCVNGNCAEGLGCFCKEGFKGTGCIEPTCDVNNMCQNESRCVVRDGITQCECQSRFTTGKMCQHICPLDCGENGSCVLENNLLKCKCAASYVGEACDLRILGPCDPSPCLNGARCSVVGSSNFTCQCVNNWGGDLCDQQLCNLSNCDRGVCLVGVGCQCVQDSYGDTCSVANCDLFDKCQNGGVCEERGPRPSCNCDESRTTGHYCEHVCPQRCINGKCGFNEGILSCVCDLNYYGETCNTDREFLRFEQDALGLAIGILLIILVFVAIIVFWTFHRKALIARALKNATFDPSDVLGLKDDAKIDSDPADTYAFLGNIFGNMRKKF